MSRIRITVLPVLLALLLPLAACNNTAAPAESTPPPESTASPDPADTGDDAEISVDDAVSQLADYTYVYEKFPADTPVMSVDGRDVPWGEYFYWLHSMVTYIEYNLGEITDWDAVSPMSTDMSNAEYVRFSAEDSLRQYYAVEINAEKNGVTLSDDDRVTLEEMWMEDVANYGGGDEETLRAYLESMFLTRDVYDRLNLVSMLYLNAYEHLYGVRGANITDDEVMEFANDQGYIQAKHILISTLDENNEPLSEELKAEKLALAEDIIAQLSAASDKQTLFDELIAQYGEDPGMTGYPEGYCFLPGTMVTEFYDGAAALNPGEISGIIETNYGYHIILRCPITPGSVVDRVSETESYDLRYYASVTFYENEVESWIDSTVIEYYDDFVDLDIAELYKK